MGVRRVGLASLARKTQRNLCPNAELAFRASRAAMQIHDRFYNREAEAVTGRVGTTGRIRPIKSVENPWQMFRPDPTAVVLDRNFNSLVSTGNHRNLDSTRARRLPHRLGHTITDNATK